jgi:hypothetical protein
MFVAVRCPLSLCDQPDDRSTMGGKNSIHVSNEAPPKLGLALDLAESVDMWIIDRDRKILAVGL